MPITTEQLAEVIDVNPDYKPESVASLRSAAREKHACPFCGAKAGQQCTGEYTGVPSNILHDGRLDLEYNARMLRAYRWAMMVGRDNAVKAMREALDGIE